MTADSFDAPQAHLTPRLDQLRKKAKKLLQAARDKDAAAIEQLKSMLPRLAGIAGAEIAESAQLANAQHAIARGAGFDSCPFRVLRGSARTTEKPVDNPCPTN